MEKDDQEADNITFLPNALLHHIFSFLPTKSLVSVASVSHRWRFLVEDHLSFTTSLDFGEEFARNQTNPQILDRINKIINLNTRDSIRKFRLFFNPTNDLEMFYAMRWVGVAATKGVREVELDFRRHLRQNPLHMDYVIGRREAFELPSFLFECEVLESAKFSRCILGLPEEFLGFKYLHTLCLWEVHVTENMVEGLLAGCPVLEVLVLKECGSLNRVKIKSHDRLKGLTVYECYNASTVEISCPALQSLLVSADHLDSCTLPEVEEAFIGTRGEEFGGVLYIFMKVFDHLALHVKSLTLYLGYLVPSLIKDVEITFRNLRELQLINGPLFGVFDTDIYCFFRHCHCPFLEYIYIELCTVSKEANFVSDFRKPRIESPQCTFDELKTIKLGNFQGTWLEMELATFFLQRATQLESMILIEPKKANDVEATGRDTSSCSPSKEKNIKRIPKDFYELLLLRSRVSLDAQIVISEHGEDERLLSFLKKHHVSDVYRK